MVKIFCPTCEQFHPLFGSWCSSVNKENREHHTSKDIALPTTQEPLDRGNVLSGTEHTLNLPGAPLIRTRNTVRRMRPEFLEPFPSSLVQSQLREPGQISEPLPYAYAKEQRWPMSPLNSLQTSCDTLTGLPGWLRCSVQEEPKKPKFFGTLDRQELARAVKLSNKLRQHIGRWGRLNGGMVMTPMTTSLLTTIGETSVLLQSYCDCLIDILCASSSKEVQRTLLPEEFLSLHQSLQDLLGLGEPPKICNSYCDELKSLSNLETETLLKKRKIEPLTLANPDMIGSEELSDEDEEVSRILAWLVEIDEQQRKDEEESEKSYRMEDLRAQDEEEWNRKWSDMCDMALEDWDI